MMTAPGLLSRHRATLKFLFVSLLSLVMLIPLTMVRSLATERQGQQAAAARTIAARWGGPQTLGGLVVLQAAEFRSTGQRSVQTETGWRARMPSRLTIDAHIATEERYLGIYRLPVYTSRIAIRGTLARGLLDTAAEAGGLTLWLPLSDRRGLREVSALTIGPFEVPARPLSPQGSQVAGLQFSLSEADRRTLAGEETVEYRLELTLAGSGALCFLPLADTARVSLTSDWPDPEFIGKSLPAEHHIATDGVRATWRQLGLIHPFGDARAPDEAPLEALGEAAFGMRLETPVDIYQRSERSVKYGSLFIALTFVTLFLFEVTGGKTLHPVPYMLTGAALAVFYVVLLALSEYLPFAAAFALAAAMLVSIVAPYVGAVLGSRNGMLAGAMLLLTYGLLYLLVSAEHLSLLLGSLSLLLSIAAMMYLTRRVDWYAYRGS